MVLENLTIQDAFKYSYWANIALIAGYLFLYFRCWEVIKVWILAWWKRSKISLEWTKDKEWHFAVPDIPKGFPHMWQLPRGGVVEVRREAVGYGPHKIPMMLSTSEFGAAVSPSEINGEYYYQPMEYFHGYKFNDEIMRVQPPTEEMKDRYKFLGHVMEDEDGISSEKKEDVREEYEELKQQMEVWDKCKLYVAYPQHGLNPSEFIRYQKINTDPVLTETYKDYAEIEARQEQFSPFRAVMGNLHFLIPFVIMAAIAVWILQDHSMAMSAASENMAINAKLSECYQTGGKMLDIANETIRTGGAVR